MFPPYPHFYTFQLSSSRVKMSSTFAIVGSGTIGAFLIDEVLTCKASIVAAFKGVDVVISTIGYGAIGEREVLGKAAKTAGVKLFVPSDFGLPTEDAKNRFAEFLKGINLPYVRVITGLWPDYCLAQ